MENTLDIVRERFVELESERDPDFRARVEVNLGAVTSEIERIHGMISS